MSNLKNLFVRALLALSFLALAPAALAGPVYRVSLNTEAWKGQSGFLDLSYGGLVGSGTGSAFVSNFSGDFDDGVEVYHDNEKSSGSREEGFTLVSGDMLAFVSQAVRFGDTFSFDLSFGTLGDGLAADFGIGLTDVDYFALDGFPGFTFTLLAGEDTPLPYEQVPGVGVVAVPEPSEWILMATGLFLLGATRRMRKQG